MGTEVQGMEGEESWMRMYRVSYFDMTNENGDLTVTTTSDTGLDNLLDDPEIDVMGFTLLNEREVEHERLNYR